MKKNLLAFAVMPLVLFSLASCGDVSTTSAATTSAEATSTGAPTTPTPTTQTPTTQTPTTQTPTTQTPTTQTPTTQTPTTQAPTTTPAPAPAITEVTDYSKVLDLTAETSKKEVVRISGIVEKISNSTKGYINLSDPINGKTLPVYGIAAASDAITLTDNGDGTYAGAFTNPANFATIDLDSATEGVQGIEVGDYITIVGVAEYVKAYSTVEINGSYFESALKASTLTYKYSSKSTITYAEGVTADASGVTVEYQDLAEGTTDKTKKDQLDWNADVKFKVTMNAGFSVAVKLDRGYTSEVLAVGDDGFYLFKAGCINNVTATVSALVVPTGAKTYDLAANATSFSNQTTSYGKSEATIDNVLFSANNAGYSGPEGNSITGDWSEDSDKKVILAAKSTVTSYLQISSLWNFSSIKFNLRSWTDKAQGLTFDVEYSIDGETWVSTGTSFDSSTVANGANFSVESGTSMVSAKYARLKLSTTSTKNKTSAALSVEVGYPTAA